MKEFVSLLLALMMALSLVACGSKADTTTDDKTDDDTVTEPANALEKIKADGVLTVALSPDFSPWSSWTPPRPVRTNMWALTPARPLCTPAPFP